jgi:DNA modification methylase
MKGRATKSRTRLLDLLKHDLSFKGETSHPAHNTHAFAAKFPSQLPRVLIESLTKPGDVVLDPMSGSGTALVEAALMGRVGIGTDMDILAVKLSQAKTSALDLPLVRLTINQVVSHATFTYRSRALDIESFLQKTYDPKVRTFFEYWFRKDTIEQLACLVKEIRQITNPSIRNFCEVIFSSIIVTKSGGVSIARDLAHSRPHKDDSKKVKNAIEFYAEKANKALAAMEEFGKAPGKSMVVRGDTRSLPLAKGTVDLIITSPPYANAIDYMRAHKFSLYWLGLDYDYLAELRKRYIGAEVKQSVGEFPYRLASQVIKEVSKKDQRKAGILLRYFQDMEMALSEMYRVLKSGKSTVIVVGSSTIRGIDVLTHEVIGEMAKAKGFSLIGMVPRPIDRDKRMMPMGNKTNGNGIEARMHQEFVIFLNKP